MKRFFAIAAVLFALAGCDQSPTQQGTDGTNVDLTQSWPPASVGQKVTLAQTLLATNYIVLLDNSGSMDSSECSGDQSKLDVAKQALRIFAQKIPVNANLALVVFTGDTGQVLVSFGSGSGNRKLFNDMLDQVSATESTPLSGALQFSYDTMVEQAKRQLGYGVYRLIVITDGDSTDGNPGPLAEDIARTSPVEEHAIGFCVGSGHSLNRPGYTKYYTADDPEGLARGLTAAQAETPSFDASVFSPHT